MSLKTIFFAFLLLPAVCWPADQTLLLGIQGMTCPLCVAAVNKALRSTPGVIKAKTYLGREQAEVTVHENTDTQRLLAAVEAVGYTAQVIPDDNSVEPARQLSAGSGTY